MQNAIFSGMQIALQFEIPVCRGEGHTIGMICYNQILAWLECLLHARIHICFPKEDASFLADQGPLNFPKCNNCENFESKDAVPSERGISANFVVTIVPEKLEFQVKRTSYAWVCDECFSKPHPSSVGTAGNSSPWRSVPMTESATIMGFDSKTCWQCINTYRLIALPDVQFFVQVSSVLKESILHQALQCWYWKRQTSMSW